VRISRRLIYRLDHLEMPSDEEPSIRCSQAYARKAAAKGPSSHRVKFECLAIIAAARSILSILFPSTAVPQADIKYTNYL